MLQKQNRTLLIFGLILIVGLLLLTFTEPPTNEVDKKWSSIYQAPLTEITLFYPDQTFRLSKEGSWKSTLFPMEKTAMLELTQALEELECGDKFTGNPADVGVEPPHLIVETVDETGKKNRLELGHDIPVGYGTYLKCSEQDGVRISRARLSHAFPKEGQELLDRRPFSNAADFPKELTAITYQDLTLEKIEGEWFQTHPQKNLLSMEAMENTLEQIFSLTAEKLLLVPEGMSNKAAPYIKLTFDDEQLIFQQQDNSLYLESATFLYQFSAIPSLPLTPELLLRGKLPLPPKDSIELLALELEGIRLTSEENNQFYELLMEQNTKRKAAVEELLLGRLLMVETSGISSSFSIARSTEGEIMISSPHETLKYTLTEDNWTKLLKHISDKEDTTSEDD